MLIKYQALPSQLSKKLHAVYVLVGQDHYLLNEAAFHIKKTWRQRAETDEKIIDLHDATDWNLLLEEARSYSLFSEQLLIDARFDKKTIDKTGKESLNQYLQAINPRTLILLQAPKLPIKTLPWLTNHEQVVTVHITPLLGMALQSWITKQLQERGIRHDPQVAALIHQYTEGNMLAAAQAIEKIALVYEPTQLFSLEEAKAQLIDLCEFQLYELADACLAANTEKAIHLLRLASVNRSEPPLILWLLTQELRQLIQLSLMLKQGLSFLAACKQLNIWSQRSSLYESALARLPLAKLYHLLHNSKQIDEQIKSNQSRQLWQSLERLALSIALPQT